MPNLSHSLQNSNIVGYLVITGQIDGGAPPPVVEGAYYIVTTAGGAYALKSIYLGAGGAWTLVYTTATMPIDLAIVPSVALAGGTDEYAAETLYFWDSGTSVFVVDGSAAAAAAAAVAAHAALTQTHGAAAGEVLPAMVSGLAGITKAASGKLIAAVQNTDYVTRDITGAITQTFAGASASGTDTALSISPTYTQTGTAGSCDLYINRTDTALGSGTHYFANFCVATVQKFAVTNQGKVLQTALLNAATGNSYAYNLEYTTNKATSGDDYGLRVNQTDTLSPSKSYLAWFGRNNNERVWITNEGIQSWFLYTGDTCKGRILYSLPGGLPGIIFFNGPAGYSNRFNLYYGIETVFSLNFNDDDIANIGLYIKKGGNVGINTMAPSYDFSFGGDAARTVGLERHTTSNTAGSKLTFGSGGCTLLATDKAGGDRDYYSGISTGQGLSGHNFYCYGAQAVVGGIVTATLNDGGSGYVATETVTITNGANDATWQIDTVDGSGKALTGHVVAAGTVCTCVTGAATTGGSGTGLKINITKTTRETDNTAVLALTLSALAVTTTLTSIAAYHQTSTAPTANSTGTVAIKNKTADLLTDNAGWYPLKTNAGTIVYVPYWT